MKFGLKSILLAGIPAFLFAFPIPAFAADTAVPAAAKILVGNVPTSFDAYNINGNNYFKLRDIAYALNGSAKQFEVTWDTDAASVLLKTDTAYTAVGGEMSEGSGDTRELTPADVKVQIDGSSLTLRAYNIQNHNYFKLRDMGRLLNFGVMWNATAKSVTIAPNADYVEEGVTFYMKSFGSYSTSVDWPESAEFSQNEKYFYLKNDMASALNIGSISVESGRHRYAEGDYHTFRDTVYRRLLKQVANDRDAGFLFGDDSATARGYTLYTFTIEYESIDQTDRMYYIVGDYKYILITETDCHNENAADITAAAADIVNSFEWAR
jgi:hypothetical protein